MHHRVETKTKTLNNAQMNKEQTKTSNSNFTKLLVLSYITLVSSLHQHLENALEIFFLYSGSS